jgi:hypothetical protein
MATLTLKGFCCEKQCVTLWLRPCQGCIDFNPQISQTFQHSGPGITGMIRGGHSGTEEGSVIIFCSVLPLIVQHMLRTALIKCSWYTRPASGSITKGLNLIRLPKLITDRAGLWVGRAGPLPRALTSRGRQKGGHRPATR